MIYHWKHKLASYVSCILAHLLASQGLGKKSRYGPSRSLGRSIWPLLLNVFVPRVTGSHG